MEVNKIATIAALKEGEEIRIKSEGGKLVIYRLTPGIRDFNWGKVYECRNNTFNEGELHKVTTELVKELGIPANWNGYNYIIKAIEMVVENPNTNMMVTKEIYPDIAEEYKTTSSRVERGIRYEIITSYTRGNLKKIQEIFGHIMQADGKIPSNRKFIAIIANYIRIKNL